MRRDNIALVILDSQWRAVECLPRMTDWRLLVQRLLDHDSRWLMMDQRRPVGASTRPDAADIALTRALCRRLRPMDMMLADHVIRTVDSRFSFRAAGLL